MPIHRKSVVNNNASRSLMTRTSLKSNRCYRISNKEAATAAFAAATPIIERGWQLKA